MINIAIIGAGQLGSRHLQGLKQIHLQTNIFVLDVDKKSLEIAKQRYLEMPENLLINNISFIENIHELPPNLDLVIISTNSKPRASITKNLIEQKAVKNILFEKVLFPSLQEYTEIEDLLNSTEINAWVNCSRRIFDHYKYIRNYFKGKKVLFKVIGKNWGLGCNSIHFLDLFSMLTGQTDIMIETHYLDKIVHKSKRFGYVEFTGKLIGRTEIGSNISISSLADYDGSFSISIESENDKVLIEEEKNRMIINGTELIISTPFQSQLTGRIAEQIINHGFSELPLFSESSKLHKSILLPLISFYNELSGVYTDCCPIT